MRESGIGPGTGDGGPPATAPVARRPGPGRATVLVAALVLLLVAVGSGLFGGWVATRLDDQEQTAGRPGVGGSGAAGQVTDSAAVVAEVSPSVVSISAGGGTGSGVVLDEDGHILTNYHVVVAGLAEAIVVTFSDGDRAVAQVVGIDPPGDLAVIQAEGVDDLVPAEFGDSDAVVPGQPVLALGNPLGLEGTVTSGIISAKNRTIQVGDRPSPAPGQPPVATSISGVLQTDAPINPGNSGGALVNLAGEVIGINSAIATSGVSSGNIGVGFAIPSNTAAQTAEKLLAGAPVPHPYIGVSVGDARGGGALIQDVTAGSPAARAGLRPGDVVLEAGGAEINDSDDLVNAVQRAGVGARLPLQVDRGGQPLRLAVTVGDLPD
ncbi:MAG TPA: trypsin-like peptidase domain-containing protein [Natronosporangium sp.]|nr:trypsin-like peptidase domain-containing protein [Natronosporangium sp.]